MKRIVFDLGMRKNGGELELWEECVVVNRWKGVGRREAFLAEVQRSAMA